MAENGIPNMEYIDIDKVDSSSLSANRINYTKKEILIYDEIDMHLAKEISTHLPNLDKFRSDIIIKINSCGGDIYATQSIITEIKKIENRVIADISGVAYSGAAMIALACDEIRISELGVMMLHYPNWSSEATSTKEHETDVKVTKEYFERIMKILLTRTKQKWGAWKEQMGNKDLFLKPSECLKLGVVDHVY